MRSDMWRYLVGFLAAVGLIVVVIILIVRSLVSGPGSSSPSTQPQDLTSYATTETQMRLTIDTPVAAPEKHRDIIITVGRDTANLTVTQGYQGQVVRSKTYKMDEDAYAVFLHALKANGFTSGNTDPSQADERGRCALGDRFIYQVINPEGNEIQHLWRTSCGSGTFSGQAGVVRRLFQNQIPNYFNLVQDVMF